VGFLQNITTAYKTWGRPVYEVKSFEDEIETAGLQLVTGKGWEELRSGLQTVRGNEPGTISPKVDAARGLQRYRGWVYPVVNIIANEVAAVPYYLYKEKSKQDREAFERVLSHPIIKLLKRPNEYLSGRQLMRYIFLNLELAGCAFVKILSNGAGKPAQLIPYPPHCLVQVELGTTPDTFIKGFHFSNPQNKMKTEFIPWKDMLYFHYPHPENPYVPMSPLQAMSHATEIDLHLQVYTKGFFENGARPDFVIIPEKQIGKVAAERVSEGWMARFRGPGKNFKPAVMSENVKIQQLSMSAHDFEFLSMANWTKEVILSGYGVPEAMLGIMGESNKSASLNTQNIFAKNCLSPRLRMFEDCINAQLVTRYRNLDGYEFEFANALARDDEFELSKNQTELSIGLVTLNEIRRREGVKPFKSPLAEVPWVGGQPLPGNSEEADKLWKDFQSPPQPMGAVPGEESNAPEDQGNHGVEGGRPTGQALTTLVNQALQNSRPALSALLSASRGRRGGLAGLLAAHSDEPSIQSLLGQERSRDMGLTRLLTKAIRDYALKEYGEEEDKLYFDIIEDYFSIIVPLEESFAEESGKFFVQKGIEIADIVTKNFSKFTTKGSTFDIDESVLREDYISQASSFVHKAVEAGYQSGFLMVQKSGFNDFDPPDVYEKESLRAAGKFLNRSADLKVVSTKRALTEIIREGLDKGLDSDAVAEMIQKRFEDIGTKRAEMISRTELAAGAFAGVDASYRTINKDSGKIVVKRCSLLPTLGERTCKECNSEKGQTIVDYVENKTYLEMPRHPYCACLAKPEME